MISPAEEISGVEEILQTEEILGDGRYHLVETPRRLKINVKMSRPQLLLRFFLEYKIYFGVSMNKTVLEWSGPISPL